MYGEGEGVVGLCVCVSIWRVLIFLCLLGLFKVCEIVLLYSATDSKHPHPEATMQALFVSYVIFAY